MTRKEQIEQAAEDFAGINYDVETESDSFYHYVQKEAFSAGVAWADEHPDLYSVTRKAVERERKHLIDKACKRLENIFHDRSHHSGRGDAGEIVTYDFDSMEEFISQFRKDMEEQQ